MSDDDIEDYGSEQKQHGDRAPQRDRSNAPPNGIQRQLFPGWSARNAAGAADVNRSLNLIERRLIFGVTRPTFPSPELFRCTRWTQVPPGCLSESSCLTPLFEHPWVLMGTVVGTL